MAFRLRQAEFLFQSLHGGRLRHGVRHVDIGRHATIGCRTAFALDVGLLGQSGFAEMHVRVDNTGQHKTARGIDHAVERATGRLLTLENG